MIFSIYLASHTYHLAEDLSKLLTPLIKLQVCLSMLDL